jgi:hypothetical protein
MKKILIVLFLTMIVISSCRTAITANNSIQPVLVGPVNKIGDEPKEYTDLNEPEEKDIVFENAKGGFLTFAAIPIGWVYWDPSNSERALVATEGDPVFYNKILKIKNIMVRSYFAQPFSIFTNTKAAATIRTEDK